MASNYLEVANVLHNFDEYSPEKVKLELERLRETGEDSHQIGILEGYLDRYQDEFAVLYRVGKQAAGLSEDDEKIHFDFKEIPYRRPEIEPEEYEIVDKTSQLELECTFEDGTQFNLSALKATPKSADELPQMVGQISFSEETLNDLATLKQTDQAKYEEKLNKIFDFCHKYGFSVFGLSLPMRGGEIDVDAKLAEMLEAYNEKTKETLTVDSLPEIDEDKHDTISMEPSDYNILADNISLPEIQPEEEINTAVEASKPQLKTLESFVNNMHRFLRKDLHKRQGLSYWEHVRTIDGRTTYVFSIYDKENPKNYENDGRKKKDVYEPTYSARLYVSQDANGKFCFGYATPGGKPIDAALAGDYMGEIKKTGITHLNFSNIPNHDKKTWLDACAEKGIVPTGLSLTQNKVEGMLKLAALKLSTEEYSNFERRLVEQWEENAAMKGQELSISDQEFIRKCKNDAENKKADQYGLLEKAQFEQKFKNFRDSYDAPDGLLMTVNDSILKGSLNKKTGAASTIGAMCALARTFDVVLGPDNNLETTLNDRLDYLLKNPLKDEGGRTTLVYITEDEKRALSSLLHKQIKDLNKEDYKLIYDTLFERQRVEARNRIIQSFKDDDEALAHAKDHVLIGEEWNRALGQVQQMNKRLSKIGSGVDQLTLPDKHSGLSYERPPELTLAARKKREAEAKAKEEAEKAKAESGKGPLPPHGSDGRGR